MAYYVPVDQGPDAAQLNSFEPSFGASLRSSVQSTFNENPTTLLWDYGRLRAANSGPKLARERAQEQIKGAGLSLTVPEDGYTQEALDIVIGRQQQAAARQSMDERTPWGWGSLVRGSAQLLTGVADPLNVASAFVPVVREARAASWMARAGEGFAARAGTRAAIGAVEGAAGAAMLEPLVFGLHSAMQDDYDMTDSLVNLAFGTVLGGVLHSGAGMVADVAGRRTARMQIDALRQELSDVTQTVNVSREAVAQRAAAGELSQADIAVLVARAEVGEPEAIRLLNEAAAPGYIRDAERTTDAASVDEPPIDIKALSEKELVSLIARAEAGDGEAVRLLTEAARPAYIQPKQASAIETIAAAEPQVHEAAFRSAVADSVQGRVPDVEAVVRTASTAGPVDAVRATAQRQTAPDALAIGSPEVSRAADERLALAPKDEAVESATAQMTEATQQYQAIRKNLELGGVPPSRLEAVDNALAAYDEGVKDAKNIGEAIMQYALCGVRQ
jgi:NACalpha-BTF3-like transcription factor